MSPHYRDWETDRKSTRLNSSHITRARMPSSAWPQGHAVIGNVTFQSCAYVARYILKKVNGKKAVDAYTRVDSADSYRLTQGPGTTSLNGLFADLSTATAATIN